MIHWKDNLSHSNSYDTPDAKSNRRSCEAKNHLSEARVPATFTSEECDSRTDDK